MILLFILAHLSAAAAVSSGREGGDADEPETGDGITSAFVIAAIRESREQFRSGVCSFHGARIEESPEHAAVDGEVTGFLAFDADKGLLRCDRSEPTARMVAQEDDEGNDADARPPQRAIKAMKVTLTTKCILSPELSAIYRGEVRRVEKRRADNHDWFPWEAPIDARCAGLHAWLNLTRGDRFETVMSALEKYPPAKVVSEGAGVLRLQWTFRDLRITKWVDENKDYLPIRSEMQDRGNPRGVDWVDPVDVTETTWEQMRGVWLPKTCRIEHRTRIPERERKRLLGEGKITYALSFSWSEVNEPPNTEYFDVSHLDVPDGTFIGDFRGATPFIEEIAGAPRREHLPEPLNPKVPRAVWWVACVVLAVVLAAAIFFRRARGAVTK